MLRERLDVGPADFARKLNISSETLLGYEMGTHRICAAKLVEMALTLNVPVAYFFSGSASDDPIKH